jgi:hypothetical protein
MEILFKFDLHMKLKCLLVCVIALARGFVGTLLM